MRLFLAIFPPESVRLEILKLQQILKDRITRQGVRFTYPDKIHLTLAFLGDRCSPEDAIERATPLLAPLTSPDMQVSGLGCFPSEVRPKTIWLGVKSAEIQTLGQALNQEFESGDEAFAPHVTLVRVSPASQAVGRLLRPLGPQFQSDLSWIADKVDLVSTLGDGRYETLSRFPLRENS
jgi:2'-5' RNA ligase